MKIQRELIYEDKLSLDDFEIDTESSLDCAFYDMLQKVEKLPQYMGEDLEKSYLRIFNDAYFIATSVLKDKRPELRFEEYKKIACEEVVSPQASIISDNSIRGFCILSMVRALLDGIEQKDKNVQRFCDKLRTWLNGKADNQWIVSSLSSDPFTPRKTPNLSPREITPSLLVGVQWSNIITLFNKQGEFQKAQVDTLVKTLGKTVNEKIYIIDAIGEYLDEMERNELPF